MGSIPTASTNSGTPATFGRRSTRRGVHDFADAGRVPGCAARADGKEWPLVLAENALPDRRPRRTLGVSMFTKRSTLGVIAMLATVVLTGCASTQRGPSEWDGLVRMPGTRLNAVFVKPDAEIPAYRNIWLKPAQVSFARNFDPNRGGRSSLNRLDAGDLAAIQTGVAGMLDEIFREELTTGGYQFVNEAGPDTLIVIPAIVDLFITAPDTMTAGRSRTYSANSGRMTLVLELRDSMTGEILARVVDTRSGRGTGMMTVTNRVTNTADARRAIRVWAQALRSGLDSLYKGEG